MSFIKGKVVFVGDTTVGKTSLINKQIQSNESIKPTVGGNSYAMKINTDKGNADISVWDTAGQEEFLCLIPVYAQNSQIAVIVFDLNQEETFNSLDKWYDTLTNSVGVQSVIIAANKSDLEYNISFDQALEWCDSRHLMLLKTSAVTGEGVNELFSEIGLQVIEGDENKTKPTEDKVEFRPKETKENDAKKKKGCNIV